MAAAVLTTAAIAALLVAAIAWRTASRLRPFDQLPTHFDLRGRADAFGPRRVILVTVPAILITTLAGIAATLVLVPRDLQNGNPVVGMAVCGIAVVGAQVLVAWLLGRWAAEQKRT